MTAPSAQTLQRLAGETGHQAATLEKVLRLLDLLQEIAHDPVLSERLALKGGTALNLFHLSLDRLSVDIDLNYVGALDRAVMESERPSVDAAISRLLASQGYAVRRQPEEHAGGKWIGRYASALGGSGTLEVDVSYMARQPLFGVARMDSIPLGGIRAYGVLVLDLHEIVAGKLVALVDRQAARDLFDARRILLIDGLDWRKVKAALLAIGACARRDWRTASLDAIRGDPREFRQKLSICLPRDRFSEKGDIDTWMEETVTLCRERLAFLFALTENEREFLDGVLDRGEVVADLLDIDSDIRARIGSIPMLAWKCLHARRHRGLSG
ncbi:nucleotidyl transferase AbiEii/AbiGii toxin family protein [Verrucomicrobium sp. 3C]|uniref:nucleotidyl transferase AbiEii/AbiGii toxin family protein n=1 Tax=Verrucomicrobium sp. 3C TaxID=1134055 RepID=UPI00037E82D0|nr:nucleotidyl transferase AbiEii/AbiGii toxin family protein [Verrucomicrobium sp. 3C]